MLIMDMVQHGQAAQIWPTAGPAKLRPAELSPEKRIGFVFKDTYLYHYTLYFFPI